MYKPQIMQILFHFRSSKFHVICRASFCCLLYILYVDLSQIGSQTNLGKARSLKRNLCNSVFIIPQYAIVKKTLLADPRVDGSNPSWANQVNSVRNNCIICKSLILDYH